MQTAGRPETPREGYETQTEAPLAANVPDHHAPVKQNRVLQPLTRQLRRSRRSSSVPLRTLTSSGASTADTHSHQEPIEDESRDDQSAASATPSSVAKGAEDPPSSAWKALKTLAFWAFIVTLGGLAISAAGLVPAFDAKVIGDQTLDLNKQTLELNKQSLELEKERFSLDEWRALKDFRQACLAEKVGSNISKTSEAIRILTFGQNKPPIVGLDQDIDVSVTLSPGCNDVLSKPLPPPPKHKTLTSRMFGTRLDVKKALGRFNLIRHLYAYITRPILEPYFQNYEVQLFVSMLLVIWASIIFEGFNIWPNTSGRQASRGGGFSGPLGRAFYRLMTLLGRGRYTLGFISGVLLYMIALKFMVNGWFARIKPPTEREVFWIFAATVVFTVVLYWSMFLIVVVAITWNSVSLSNLLRSELENFMLLLKQVFRLSLWYYPMGGFLEDLSSGFFFGLFFGCCIMIIDTGLIGILRVF
jgi:hypothetical protein